MLAKSLSLKGVIPFSSHHQYQRSDSIWAQEFTTPTHAYEKGLDTRLLYIKPFSVVECDHNNKSYPIDVEKINVKIKKPEDFDDNYSDILEKKDLDKIRKYCPGIAISGDFIVGFPGETEKDFNETLSLVREIFSEYADFSIIDLGNENK